MMVAAAITTAGDTIDRAKALKRFIELASLLQGGVYGNLFSFMAIMKGLASPQVTEHACAHVDSNPTVTDIDLIATMKILDY